MKNMGTGDQRPVSRKSRNLSGDLKSLCIFKTIGSRDTKLHYLFQFLSPLQDMKRPALQSKPVGVLEMAFQTEKVVRTFEKRVPVPFCFESL